MMGYNPNTLPLPEDAKFYQITLNEFLKAPSKTLMFGVKLEEMGKRLIINHDGKFYTVKRYINNNVPVPSERIMQTSGFCGFRDIVLARIKAIKDDEPLLIALHKKIDKGIYRFHKDLAFVKDTVEITVNHIPTCKKTKWM
jgi:hypothetical protein